MSSINRRDRRLVRALKADPATSSTGRNTARCWGCAMPDPYLIQGPALDSLASPDDGGAR